MARTPQQRRRARVRAYLDMARALGIGEPQVKTPLIVADGVSVATQATYTFSNVAFGPPAVGRYIIVGIGYRAAGNVTISSVTIGGVAATVSGFVRESTDGNSTCTAFAAALVPTGISGRIVVVLSANAVRCCHATWRATGLSEAAASDTATAVGASPGTADPSVTIDEYEGGVLLAFEIFCDGTNEKRSAGSKLSAVDAAGATVSVVNSTSGAAWTGVNEDVDAANAVAGSSPQSLSVASWQAGAA